MLTEKRKLRLYFNISILFISFFIIIIGIYIHKNFSQTHGYKVKTYYSNINGLLEGAPVTYLGFQVGRVTTIDVQTQQNRVLVNMALKKDIPIPSGCCAEIHNKGFMGDVFIELTGGNTKQSLQESTKKTLQGREAIQCEDIVENLYVTINNIQQLTSQFLGIMNNRNIQGSTRSILDSIETLSFELKMLVQEIGTGIDFMPKLKNLFARDLKETILEYKKFGHELNKNAIIMTNILKKVSHSNGTLSLLLNDNSLYENFNTFAYQINENPSSILFPWMRKAKKDTPNKKRNSSKSKNSKQKSKKTSKKLLNPSLIKGLMNTSCK